MPRRTMPALPIHSDSGAFCRTLATSREPASHQAGLWIVAPGIEFGRSLSFSFLSGTLIAAVMAAGRRRALGLRDA